MYKVIIEIPKGDDRRRHWNKEKKDFVDLGPLKDVIPVNGGTAPANYGFILGTLNEADGDEIDVLVLSDNDLSIGQEVEIEPIAIIRRVDGDHKLISTDRTLQNIKKWEDVPESERDLIKNFVSHHFAIEKIEDSESAVKYVEENRAKKLQDGWNKSAS